MRYLAGFLVLIPLLAQAGCARRVQESSSVRINDVRIGFAGGAGAGHGDGSGRLFKPGEWAPVFVDLTAGPDGVASGTNGPDYQLVTATADNDNIRSVFPLPLPALKSNEQAHVVTYVKPCGTRDEVTIGIRHKASGAGDLGAGLVVRQSPLSLDLGEHLFLVAGMDAPGLEQALDRSNESNPTKYHIGHLAGSERLPDEWFGYSAVDLLLIGTADRSFAKRVSERPFEKRALTQWLQRGGRLLISTGRHPEEARQIIEQLGLGLPVEIGGQITVPRLEGIEIWLRERQPPPMADLPGGARVEIARLKPGRAAETVVSQKEGGDVYPLVVRTACGLGQVTLVAFDVDQPPFRGWPTEPEFWYKLLNIPRPNPDAAAQTTARKETPEETAADLASSFQNNLEQFADVPVISYGLVAFFMFVYIVVVGPLDYFILRRFFKRLELTWISFPILVLIGSGLAYGTAYRFKGDEVRINKIDLVDIDFHSKQIYGNSWFSVFSPRNQDFQLTLQTREVIAGPATVQDSLLSWLARPENGFGGYGRTRVQGFVRSSYEYLPRGDGLEGVPAAAWSAKSFSARWTRPLDVQRPPISADLLQRSDGRISGPLTNRLPADIDQAYLIVGGEPTRHTAFSIGKLLRGDLHRLNFKPGEQGGRVAEWLMIEPTEQGEPVETAQLDMLVRRLMFYDESTKQDHASDVPLHYLDQSWRLPLKGEAILVGRLTHVRGPIHEVAVGEASPSRLAFGQAAPPGTMEQDTYVRILLPLRQEETDRSLDPTREKR
jgi:hypothetical protein